LEKVLAEIKLLPRLGEEILDEALFAAADVNFFESEFLLLKLLGGLGARDFTGALGC
jgi:hypothetical protein